MEEKNDNSLFSQEEIDALVSALKNVEESLARVQQAFLDGEEIDPETMKTLNYLLGYMHVVSLALKDAQLFYGARAYKASVAFYEHLKKAAEDKVPGAQEIYDKLTPLYLESLKETPDPLLTNLNNN